MNQVVLTGEQNHSTLYLLNLKPAVQNVTRAPIATPEAALRASLSVWHQRFGHANYRISLRSLVKIWQLDSILLMTTKFLKNFLPPVSWLSFIANPLIQLPICTLDVVSFNHTRYIFCSLLLGRNRPERIGGIIHADVWSPAEVECFGDRKYYL